MLVRQTLERVEGRLAGTGRTVGDLCDQAGIARSTWQRWKSGLHSPNMKTLEAVVATAERIAEAASEEAASNRDTAA